MESERNLKANVERKKLLCRDRKDVKFGIQKFKDQDI